LWTVKEGTQVLTPGTGNYDLDPQVFDIVDAYLRTDAGNTNGQFDQSMSRISISQYAHLSNKLTQSKPLEYYVERKPTGITIKLWPVPDSQETYTFGFYYMERVEDSGKPASNNMDVPARFLPCLVAGLAYNLAKEISAGSRPRSAISKADYDEQWEMAADAARDKASLFISPGGYTF
jgi:hypothetical protein